MSSRAPIVCVLALVGCGATASTAETRAPAAASRRVAATTTDPCSGVPAIAWSGVPVNVEAYDLELEACVHAGDRGWSIAVEITEVLAADEEGERGVSAGPHVRGRLTLLCSDGPSVSARHDLGAVELGGLDRNEVSVGAVAADYDGDGRGELVLRVGRGFYEGGDVTSSVLTCRGDTIGDYAPAARFADFVLGTTAADGDGRLDVWSGRPFTTGSNGGSDGGSASFGGPRALWHALPDGTFTWRDEVGRAALARECEELRGPLYESYGGPFEESWSQIVERMTCALLAGEGPSPLRMRIVTEQPREQCLELADEASCDEELAALDEHLDRVLAILEAP